MLTAAQLGGESLDACASLRNPIQPPIQHSVSSVEVGGQKQGRVRPSTAIGVMRPGSALRVVKEAADTGANMRASQQKAQQKDKTDSASQSQEQQAPGPDVPARHNPTSAQHLASMLPWNRDPYLQVRVRAAVVYALCVQVLCQLLCLACNALLLSMAVMQ